MDVALLIFLILLNGVFAMSEMALTASRKARLQVMLEAGEPGVQSAMELHDNPTKFLSTVQIGITSIGVLNGIVGEAAFAATRNHMTGSRFSHLDNRLADLPNLRARLAEMRFRIDQSRSYLASTLELVEAGDAGAMPHVLALKAVSGEMAVDVTDLAMRTCGGAAFSKHLGVERHFRDARAAIVMAPTTDHLKEFVGRLLVGLPLFS